MCTSYAAVRRLEIQARRIAKLEVITWMSIGLVGFLLVCDMISFLTGDLSFFAIWLRWGVVVVVIYGTTKRVKMVLHRLNLN